MLIDIDYRLQPCSGRLGPWILKALQPNYDLTVVTRSSSARTFPAGTKVVKVGDGYKADEMVSVFRGQDAVVLCLGYPALQHEITLTKASIEAGVKSTIVNGYGNNDGNQAVKDIFPIAEWKGQVLSEVKKLAESAPATWSWTSISIGLLFDLTSTPSMGGGMFFGLNPAARTAKFMGDGSFKFSATNAATVVEAVSKVLSKPEETANRSVYVSSFQVSLNELLNAYKKATGKEDWTVSYDDVDESIKEAQRKRKYNPESMMLVAKLAMAVQLKKEFGPNFEEECILDNDLLGLPHGSIDETVATVLKDGLNCERLS